MSVTRDYDLTKIRQTSYKDAINKLVDGYGYTFTYTPTDDDGVSIDWGDGSAIESPSEGGGVQVSVTHYYEETGYYTIRFLQNSGTANFIRYSVPSSIIKQAHVPDWVQCQQTFELVPYPMVISFSAHNNPISSVPGVGKFPIIIIPNENNFSYAGYTCPNITTISLPQSETELLIYTGTGSASLSRVIIPDGVTRINNNALANIPLPKITIPENVIYIGQALYNVELLEINVYPETPPTMTSSSTFAALADNCIITVPAGTLEAYQTADYWSAFADYMVERA